MTNRFGEVGNFVELASLDLDLVQGGREFAQPVGHFAGMATSQFSFHVNGIAGNGLAAPGGNLGSSFGGGHLGDLPNPQSGGSGGLLGGHVADAWAPHGLANAPTISGGFLSGNNPLLGGHFGGNGSPNGGNGMLIGGQLVPAGSGVLGGMPIDNHGHGLLGGFGTPVDNHNNGVVGGTMTPVDNHNNGGGGTVAPVDNHNNGIVGGTVAPVDNHNNGVVGGTVAPVDNHNGVVGGTVAPVDPTLAGNVIGGNVDPALAGNVIGGNVDPTLAGNLIAGAVTAVDPALGGHLTPTYQAPPGLATTSFDIQTFGDPHVQSTLNGVVQAQIDYMPSIANFATFANTVGGATTISTNTYGSGAVTVNHDVTLTGHSANGTGDWSLNVDGSGVVTLNDGHGATTTASTQGAPAVLHAGNATITTTQDHVLVHQDLADGGHVDTEIAVHSGPGANVDVETHGQGNAGLSGFVAEDHHADANATYTTVTYDANAVADTAAPAPAAVAPVVPAPTVVAAVDPAAPVATVDPAPVAGA